MIRNHRSMKARVGVAAVLALAATFGGVGKAHALQPLSEFRAGARTKNLDVRESAQVTAQRDAEATQASYKLLPSLVATAGYTRNQYESVVTTPIGNGETHTATITPKNQLDGLVTVSIPIIDVASWRRVGASEAIADAQVARGTATQLDVESNVTRAYYQVVADEALLAAAQRTVAASEESLGVVRQRHEAGMASELDLRRSAAEVDQRKQSVAEADYQLAVARRSLATLSGIAPTPDTTGGAVPADDLHEESSLVSWESSAGELPHVQAARLDVRAAEKNAGVTAAALLPTIAASGTERLTNAAGFGQSPSWSAGVLLTWRLDASTVPAIRAQDAAAAAARVREEKQTALVRDQIHDAWQRVRAQIAKSRAARAQLDASRVAERLAGERYRAGTATLLDVIIAERDAFSAEIAQIQADSDLAYARAALHTAAGRTL
jgi:outer membrane protein